MVSAIGGPGGKGKGCWARMLEWFNKTFKKPKTGREVLRPVSTNNGLSKKVETGGSDVLGPESMKSNVLMLPIMESYDPRGLRSPEEEKLLAVKRELLRRSIESFKSAGNLDALVSAFADTARGLFPNAKILLLAKKEKEDVYEVIFKEGEGVDVQKLNLSARDSIVRLAGEVHEGARRTIYIPDLNKSYVFQDSEFDTGIGGRMVRNYHEIEEGTIEQAMEQAKQKFDLTPLKEAGLEAIAVAPILEYKYEPPVGAVILIGKRAFLNPLVDLIVLRELADKIAEPLKKNLA